MQVLEQLLYLSEWQVAALIVELALAAAALIELGRRLYPSA